MKIKLSACTITKNEEKNIERSINSYKEYVDEIIIVDTGSTDNTVEVAKALGAKVIEYKWNNDFASARNCALDNATGEWILFLDADEWIADGAGKELKKSIEKATENGFDAISGKLVNLSDDGSILETMSILRIFANKDNIRYRRRIHELLYDFNKKHALESLYIENLAINHSGYAQSISKEKVRRNRKFLEEIYALGEAEPLDYFYLARENLVDYPERADYFLNLLVSSKDYMNSLKDINIGNNLEELKIRLSNKLTDRYSFEQRLSFIEEAIKNNPNNPINYYYKYVLYSGIDDMKYKELLEKAMRLDKEYEKKSMGSNNAFYNKKFEALYELSRCELKEGNNVKVLDYLAAFFASGQRDSSALKLMLSVISTQSTEEVIAFIDSMFKTSEKEDLKFIIESLRVSDYKDVFLYYFVKFYKLFGELDISFFSSRMITGNYKEMFDKYWALFNETKQEKALVLLCAALVAGDLREDYLKIKTSLHLEYMKILAAYFDGYKCEFDEKIKRVFSYIFTEVAYILTDERLAKLSNAFVNNEATREFIIDYYFNNYSYQKIIDFCSGFIDEELSDYFGGKVTAALGFSYFRLGNYDTASGFLEQSITIGYLDEFVKCAYESMLLQNGIKSIPEFVAYKEELYRLNMALKFEIDKIEDCSGVAFAKNIKDFMEETNKKYVILEYFAEKLFKFAKKNLVVDNIYLAEEYYKLLLRCNYKTDLVLYDLGKIYDKAHKCDISFYCYQKAFITNFSLASKILSEGSANRNYLYANLPENDVEKCPLCNGKDIENKNTICYVEKNSEILDKSPIVMYRYCNKCNHLFAYNYRDSKEQLKRTVSNEYIFNAYDIIEKMSNKIVDKVIIVDDRIEFGKIAKENYINVDIISEDLMKVPDLDKFMKSINKRKKGSTYLVTMISDYLYPFDKEFEVGTINYFSKLSITKLLNKYEFNHIEVYNSKYIPNKLIVIAKV